MFRRTVLFLLLLAGAAGLLAACRPSTTSFPTPTFPPLLPTPTPSPTAVPPTATPQTIAVKGGVVPVHYPASPTATPFPSPTPTAAAPTPLSRPTRPAVAATVRITFTHLTPGDHLFFYMDTDNDPTTGGRYLYPGLGVDYLIQDDSLYVWTGRSDPYTWTPEAWKWLSVVRVQRTETQSVWQFPLRAIQRTSISAERPIRVAFSRQDASWNALHFSPILVMVSRTLAYTEPLPLPPTAPSEPGPAPTPAPHFAFTFRNNLEPGDHLFLYLDTDRNAATGYAIGGIGADFMVQDYWMFRRTGNDWTSQPCALSASLGPTATWTFPASCIGDPPLGFQAIFERQNSQWAAVYTSPPVSVTSYSVHHTEQPPFVFRFNNNYQSGDHLYLYLDVDNRADTGFSIGGIGADYVVLDRWMLKWAGNDWAGHSCYLMFAEGANATWRFPTACLGHPSLGFRAIFRRANSAWTPVYTSPPVTVNAYNITHTEPSLYTFTYNNNFESDNYLNVYLDTDGNASTGFAVRNIGADFALLGGGLYQYTGSGLNWAWAPVDCTVSFTQGQNARWVFSAACIGDPQLGYPAVFQRTDSDGYPIYTSPPVTVNAYNVTYDEPLLYTFTYNNNFESDNYLNVYLDTDGNASTGFAVRSIGANFALLGGGLYQYTGSGSDWAWASVDCSVSFTPRRNARWVFPAACIGSPQLGYPAVFQRTDSGGYPIYTSPPVTVNAYNVTYDEPLLYTFTFNNNFESGNGLNVYLDTDGNASTGFAVGSIGANFALLNDGLYRYTGSGSDWVWTPVDCSVSFTPRRNARWVFPAACIGDPQLGYPAVFQRTGSGGIPIYTSSPVTVNAYNVTHTEQ